ncbi:MAG: hypothetical protein JRH11_07720 [Deltaproteobacteria bacterium]|nr:hypothetical protein [Deltaproteobacteria bacterium]
MTQVTQVKMNGKTRTWAPAAGIIAMLSVLPGLTAACGASPERGVSSAAPAPESAAWQTGSDPVSLQMQDFGRRLAQAGWATGGPTGRGFLTARGQETTEITIPRGRCATVVAITSRGIRDLDATLFAPSGDVLAEDVEPDAHPTVQVCAAPDADRRFYYSLTAYEGIGTYLYASFLGPRGGFGAAAAVVGGQPGVASAGAGEGGRDVRMHGWIEGVARRGFSPEGSPIPVILSNDQRVRVPLGVELGRCYTIIALSGPGLADVDLRILDDAGAEVVIDVSPSADASVQLCSARTASFAAEVHSAIGRGEAQVAIFSAAEARVGGSSGLWLGERQEGRRTGRDVEDVRRASAAVATAAGWRELTRVAGDLRSGGASMNRLTLPAGRCSLIVADGGRGIGRLVLRVTDRAGHTLAERGGARSSARARLCPDAPTDVSVSLISRRGEGRFTLTHFAKEVPAELAAVAERARGTLLDAVEDASTDAYRLVERVTVGAGPVPALGDGTACVRWVAVAHDGQSPVTLTLRRGEDPIDQGAGPLATVGSCAPRTELRLHAAGGGEAPIEVMRFER